MDMKIICAWCKLVIKEGTAERVSHGICKACADKAKQEIIWGNRETTCQS